MKLGVVALARSTFDVRFAQATADAAITSLRQAGNQIIGDSALVMDQAAVAAALACFDGVEIDGLVVMQASFTDTSPSIAAADLGVPVVLWAFPEERTGGRLRLNSFCGINLAGFALTNLGHDYRWIYRSADDRMAPVEITERLAGEVSRPPILAAPDPGSFGEPAAAAAVRVRDRLRATTVGRVGERPDGFEPCSYNAEVLRRVLGVSVDEVALPALFSRAREAKAEQITEISNEVSAQLSGLDQLDQESVDKSLRLKAGLTSLASEGEWAGVATRCWPETFTEFGGAVCTPMAMMTEEGTPGSCEADVYGNITGLVLQWLGDQPSFVSDLVHFDRETDTGVFWHCGLAPISMADPEVTAMATIHANRKKPLLSEFPLKPGRVTLFRVSQSRGLHRFVIGGGEMLREPQAFAGTAGVICFDRGVESVMTTVLDEGLEHHFGIVYADVRDELSVLAGLLGLPVVEL